MNLENRIKDDAKIVELYWQRNEIAIEYTQQKYETLCISISNNILRLLQILCKPLKWYRI